jgi:hypothetical protein
MCIQSGQANFSVSAGRETDNSHNAVMGHPAVHRQFAEVFVNCDKNSLFRVSECKNRIVAGISRPIADQDNVVSSCTEVFGRFAPHASI